LKNADYLCFPIDPIPKGQLFVTRTGRSYWPKKVTQYMEEIRAMAKKQWKKEPLDKPLKVEVVFHIPRPKSVSMKKRKYPSVKPDLDNLLKSFFDALEGVVFVNDSRIVTMTVSKQYSSEGNIELKIRALK